MSLGSMHTLAINGKGKIYSWGWNDKGQCCHPPEEVEMKEIQAETFPSKSLHIPEPQKKNQKYGRVVQMLCGEDHNVIKDENG